MIKKYDFFKKKPAVEQIHFPETLELLEQARFSLIFEELFLVQLKLVRLREENTRTHSALALKIDEKGLVRQFIDNLPFELTGGQKKAVNEILHDLNSDIPMARLLQGDVVKQLLQQLCFWQVLKTAIREHLWRRQKY